MVVNYGGIPHALASNLEQECLLFFPEVIRIWISIGCWNFPEEFFHFYLICYVTPCIVYSNVLKHEPEKLIVSLSNLITYVVEFLGRGLPAPLIIEPKN